MANDGAFLTAAERSARFTAELDEIDRMSPAELRAETIRLAFRGGFAGLVAILSLIESDRRTS